MPPTALERAFRDDLRASASRATTPSTCRPRRCARGSPRAAGPHGAGAAGGLDAPRPPTRSTTGAAARARRTPRPTTRRTIAFLTGEIALARRDADGAVAAFEGLLALEPARRYDGYDVRVRLALAEIHRQHAGRRRGAPAPRDRLRSDRASSRTRCSPSCTATSSAPPIACAELEAALRLEPQTDARRQGGRARRARGGPQSARVLELAPIAIFIDPADPDLHAALGRALAATGKPAAAAAAFERALALEAPDPASLHRALATSTTRSANRSRADAHRAAAGK